MNQIEIFRAGKRPDASGQMIEIKTSDLLQAVNAYDPNLHEAPAVIGHPQHNAPAYAWVKRLTTTCDILKAELAQVDPNFAEMVEAGRFKKFPPHSILLIAHKIRSQDSYICATLAF